MKFLEVVRVPSHICELCSNIGCINALYIMFDFESYFSQCFRDPSGHAAFLPEVIICSSCLEIEFREYTSSKLIVVSIRDRLFEKNTRL